MASDLDHDPNCDFWCDQYPDECTCGLTRPRHPAFVPWSQIRRDRMQEIPAKPEVNCAYPYNCLPAKSGINAWLAHSSR